MFSDGVVPQIEHVSFRHSRPGYFSGFFGREVKEVVPEPGARRSPESSDRDDPLPLAMVTASHRFGAVMAVAITCLHSGENLAAELLRSAFCRRDSIACALEARRLV
jgi:hypothetical protein